MIAMWFALSLTLFGLLSIPRYSYSASPQGYISETYGWPGGWGRRDRFKSEKTEKQIDNRDVTNFAAFGVALLVAAAAPGPIVLPWWRRMKKSGKAGEVRSASGQG
jgi:hypothetical protein